MTPVDARQALRDRIAALTPDVAYAGTAVGLENVVWAESLTPLIPERSPAPLAALAFFVDDRRLDALMGRHNDIDPTEVNTPIVVRFLYPMREAGPATGDWDRSMLAAVALRKWLLSMTWQNSTELSLTSVGNIINRRVVGDGAWILAELAFMLQYSTDSV